MEQQVLPRQIAERYGSWLEVAQQWTQLDAGHLSGLCDVLLDHPPRTARVRAGHTILNTSGFPLQLLVSSRRQRTCFRILGEPGFHHTDPVQRLEKGLATLESLLQMRSAQRLRKGCFQTLTKILPRGREALDKYKTGMMCLAVAPESPGVGLYVGADHDPSVGWHKAIRWLKAVLPEVSEAERTILRLRSCCSLFGVAIKGLEATSGRVSLYWRLRQQIALSNLGVPILESPIFLRFLNEVMAGRSFPLEALTFSVSFSLRTGQMNDCKVDVCNNIAGMSLADVDTLIGRWASEFEHQPIPSCDLSAGSALEPIAVGFVGLGLDRRGDRRLNIYL